uniref:GDSL esterase/lipase At5g03980-like isoform X3 n=1 Tax=Nicotiana sylvestris TaxID=4096 RepID=A0A1U7VZJ7_NICSY|nr:PREDICTED: GDSL esterase/lipase At5g03980-like isoform X3 [Nicotiana sylvestris]
MALAIRVLDLLRVLSIISFLVFLHFLQKTDAQVLIPQVPTLMKCKFDKIYQLGDSLSDTGNFIRESLVGAFSPFAKLPYGENFFQNESTGRCSDGLLMIDFIECSEDLKKALFLVGEIGGNEFNYGLLQGKPMEELRAMVPEVVQTIINAVKTIIGFGAVRIVIPGNFPIGCIPNLLTTFLTNNSTAYDYNHCLKDLNHLAILYNDHLQQVIQELKKGHPNIALVYGDYYNAYLWLLKNAASLGFDKNSLLKACCGIGEKYNYDKSRICGAPGLQICTDPSTYISWDGIHLTQQAYKWLARWLIDDMLPKLKCQA